VNFAPGKMPSGRKSPQKCIYSIPAQEMAKHCAVWLASSERHHCSNKGKTRNPLKFAGVPQTSKPISAVSGPKFAILWRHVEEILLFNKVFSNCRYMPQLQRYSRSCAMVRRLQIFGDFLRTVFSASRVQHISDLHSKFALRPHHVWKYGRHPISDR